jgi:hypothetical protein
MRTRTIIDVGLTTEDVMLRDISLALALLALAGAAAADCGDSHGAKRAITEDQAQATQAPVKKAALAPSRKNVAACQGDCADKSAKVGEGRQGAVAIARNAPPEAAKPAN